MSNSTFRLSELWCMGRGVWTTIWLFNGANGATWLPLFSSDPTLALAGRLGVYISYCMMLLAAAYIFRAKLACMHKRKTLLWSASILSSIGVLCICLAGFGVIERSGLVVGMITIGAAGAIPLMAWGEFYAAMGPKKACLYFSASIIMGAAIYYAGTLFGVQHAIVFSGILVVSPLIGQFMYFKAWQLPEAPILVQKDQIRSFRIPKMPVLVMLVYGVVFGFVVGLNDAQTQQGESMINLSGALGMGLMALLLIVFSIRKKELILANLHRPLMPFLVVGFLLIPILGSNTFFVTNIIAYAGYMYIYIFAICLCADIVTRSAAPALLVACVITATYSLGTTIGSFIVFRLVSNIHLGALVLFYVTAAAITLIICVSVFLMSEEKLTNLWGLVRISPSGTPMKLIEENSIKLASEKGLTLRETNVLVELAKGFTADRTADSLYISTATVRSHQKRIYSKLEVHSQTELMNIILSMQKIRDPEIRSKPL